jgi:hypothetical protein
MSGKVVYLMRGLPSCGKSYTARQLAGPTGTVLETDEYFYTQVGDDVLEAARQWNFARFRKAIEAGISPIVVDRGNSLSVESGNYARLARDYGYRVALREPDAPWWQLIRNLLRDKERYSADLDQWAQRLALMSKATHRVPASTIRRRMNKWKVDLTVEDILSYHATKAAERKASSTGEVLADRSGSEAVD